MTIRLSTGSQFAIGTAFGTQFTISAISNANPAVATLSASHGVTVGDIIHIKSGWGPLNERVVRVSALATNDATLEGVNTLDTDKYPAGAGAGTGREVTTWTPITQVRGISTSGGEQNFTDTSTIEDTVQKQMPTTRSATSLVITVYDDPSLAGFMAASAAADAVAITPLRTVYPGGSRTLTSGYFGVQKTPNIEPNAPLTSDISFSAAGEPMRYAT